MCGHTIAALMAGLAWAFATVLAAPAQAQVNPVRPGLQDVAPQPIGKVVAVTGSVTIEHAGAVVVQANLPDQVAQTKVGDTVYLRDVVRTDADSRISINFSDGSSFNLSSNARMTLDEYVYEPAGKSNSSFFNLTKGTATFVAGQVAKTGDMKVDTPVATMGIRGTTPHIEISDDGAVNFSTLIEEGKSKLLKKHVSAPVRQPDQESRPRLNICRGC
ncbi:FecR family protein [Bradyrhizobium sp. CB2312]|uniref:FecR family protein n=1 Tax=Bradyrhizobium sp. CB2312 TaxID=3039155 RepID=UPI0024B1B0C1|nr:FecR family protein [Bradyrhizobium sp. CB2312]WFU74584.1 FecR family protein [Bradyrhizobium sp. CB2312]